MSGMDERALLARIHRRVTFGSTPGALDSALDSGLEQYFDQLAFPDTNQVEPTPDPWPDDLYQRELDGPERRQLVNEGAGAWLDTMRTAPRPLEEWMTWFWHGHLVVSVDKVQIPQLMVVYTRLLRTHALGNFGDLLRSVTTSGAMLRFLDGLTSTAENPNENYSRELLELFALGIGNYTEADVASGAAALTGWTIAPRAGVFDGRLVPRRHDEAPHSYLGRTVNDVDSVVGAVLDHPACAEHVTSRLALAVLGVRLEAALLDDLASRFRSTGYEIGPLVRSLLAVVVDQPELLGRTVMGPVEWSVASEKVLGSSLPAQATLGLLRTSGQVPWYPPNVAGWPGGATWLSSSGAVGRFNHSVALASLANGSVAEAAESSDLNRLASELGIPGGFGSSTSSALTRLGPGHGVETLTLALNSPELITH